MPRGPLGLSFWCVAACAFSSVVSPAGASGVAAREGASDTRTTAETPPTVSRHDARARFAAWLSERMPKGGAVVDDGADAPLRVVHTVQPGETTDHVARLYLDLSETYLVADYAREIARAARVRGPTLRAGTTITIPNLIRAPYRTGDEERLGWPEDKALRAAYVRGQTAGAPFFLGMLDQNAARGINAIVLDAKDYDGWVTYPSKVPLAREAGALRYRFIRDLARTVRFVHARGIRVILRIACFEDEVVARARGDLSVQAKWGRPYRIGWLDPSNDVAQQYIIDLVKEGMDAGVDEIQLDYVRYPVLGIKGADFKLKERNLTQVQVITAFVRKVHAVTQARGVPLSLDVFGVISEGKREDIEALGQDPALLAAECEVLSPMVYPSHYAPGYNGWAIPGDHPEIIGIGTRKTLDQIKAGGVQNPAIVRPWLQAMDYKSPTYGPRYLADEVRHAEANGGTGWLLWNPGQDYGIAWRAIPPRRDPSIEQAASRRTSSRRTSGVARGREHAPRSPAGR
jgi:hypothetical protein